MPIFYKSPSDPSYFSINFYFETVHVVITHTHLHKDTVISTQQLWPGVINGRFKKIYIMQYYIDWRFHYSFLYHVLFYFRAMLFVLWNTHRIMIQHNSVQRSTMHSYYWAIEVMSKQSRHRQRYHGEKSALLLYCSNSDVLI